MRCQRDPAVARAGLSGCSRRGAVRGCGLAGVIGRLGSTGSDRCRSRPSSWAARSSRGSPGSTSGRRRRGAGRTGSSCHGLGRRAAATATLFRAGLVIDRVGDSVIYVPAASIIEGRLAPAPGREGRRCRRPACRALAARRLGAGHRIPGRRRAPLPGTGCGRSPVWCPRDVLARAHRHCGPVASRRCPLMTERSSSWRTAGPSMGTRTARAARRSAKPCSPPG